MSEYQYYEFLAIDRPLSEREMGELRGISSRAQITPTQLTNEYSYGSLSADVHDLLARYFDVHVYVANWGTRRLAMRVPASVVPFDEVEQYCIADDASAWEVGEHIIIDLTSDIEDVQGWIDGEGWMGSVAGVRTALLRGDARPLYLAWLHGVETYGIEEDEVEPPVPPGLGSLPAAMEAMAELLRMDEHLIAAAAERSAPEVPEADGLAEWIVALPETEKDTLLVRAAQGEHAAVAASLVRRFRAATKQPEPIGARRTAGELLERAEELREAANRAQAQKEDEARRQREAAEAAAKARRLDALAARPVEAWEDVSRLVESKKPTAYDQAVALLEDLRALADREGRATTFAARLGELRRLHARKPTFIERLTKAGLL